MTIQAAPRLLTPQEYLIIERKAESRSEYYQGEMSLMSGASRKHNLIVGNIYACLHQQLRQRDCEVYASDMRVCVTPSGLYTYPDVIVVCGMPEFEDEEVDTLLNPTVVIEVLSRSTRNYDRGDKFEHFRALPSVLDYLLVAQEKMLVEHFARQPDNFWLFSEARAPQQVVHFRSIECELKVADIYEKVNFSETV